MNKKIYNKSELSKDLKVYAVIGTLAMGMMFVSPMLNKNIQATTVAFKNDQRIAEANISDFKDSADYARSQEHYLEQKTINTIYDSIEKGELTSQEVYNIQKENYDFSQTKESSQPAMTWGSDEMMGINTKEVLAKYAKASKIFDPAGTRGLAQGDKDGYSKYEFEADPGVFCIEKERLLTGHADPTRGLHGPTDPKVPTFTARLSEYATRVERYKKERENLLAQISSETNTRDGVLDYRKLDKGTRENLEELDKSLNQYEDAILKFKEEYPAKLKEYEEKEKEFEEITKKYEAGQITKEEYEKHKAEWEKYKEEFEKYKKALKELEDRLLKSHITKPNIAPTVRSKKVIDSPIENGPLNRPTSNEVVKGVRDRTNELENKIFNSSINSSSEWGAETGNVSNENVQRDPIIRDEDTGISGITTDVFGSKFAAISPSEREATVDRFKKANVPNPEYAQHDPSNPGELGTDNSDGRKGIVETDVKTQLTKVVDFKRNVEEADIAYIVSAYRNIGSDAPSYNESGTGYGELQGTVWKSHIASEYSHGALQGDNQLLKEAADYKAYFKKLLDFEASHGDLEDDGYTRFLRGKGYWADVKITTSGGGRKEGEERIMVNPRIKYIPRVLPGKDSTMEKSSKVNFDTQTQKWLIGPYKLDYLLEGTPQDADGNFDKIFAGMTGMKLFGIYEKGHEGKQTESTGIASIPGDEIPGITEEDLEKYAQDPDKFQTADVEKAEGLSEVKKWRIRKDGGDGNDKTIPKPNQDFYFEIDYDPALQYIKKARFEFAYMIHSGERKQYKTFLGKVQNVKIKQESDIENVISKTYEKFITDYEYGVQNGKVYRVPVYTWGFRITKGDGTKSTVKTDENHDEIIEQQQTLISVEALRWLEHVAVEVNFKDENDIKLKLRLPLGGKVWEDKSSNDKKHVGYDNLLGTEADIPLPKVKVTVMRNFVKFDGNKNVKEIIKKEYARVYDINTGQLVEQDSLFTNENGEYGPFDIHDIGFTEEELGISGKDFKGYGVVFEVRFDYDGLYYEPVVPMQTQETGLAASKYAGEAGANVTKSVADFNNATPEDKKKYELSSFAFENTWARDRFNKANATMGGKTAYNQGSKLTTGVTLASKDADKAPEHGSRLINYKGSDSSNGTNYGIQRYSSEYIQEMPQDTGKVDINKHMSSSTIEIGVKLPANEKIRFTEMESKDIEGAYEEIAGKYYASKEYMKKINLGLKKRKPVNLGLVKSLNNAIVTVNKKAYNYVYSDMYTEMITQAEKEAGMGAIDLEKKWANRDANKKDQLLDLYKTDYIYRTAMYNQDAKLKQELDSEVLAEQAKDGQNTGHEDTRALDVFITYRINIMNDSPVDTVRVDAVDDYYNDKMELVNTEIKKEIEVDPSEDKKAIEEHGGKDNPNGINLQRKELEIGLPKYKNRGKGDVSIPKEIAQINDKDVFRLTDYKFEGEIGGTYKQNTAIPSFMAASRVESPNHPIELKPDESADLYLTFRVKNADSIRTIKRPEALGALREHVSNGDIQELDKALELGEFENVAEIARFTTYNTLNGKASGKYDDTSAPDNVDLNGLDKGNVLYEDDTDGAPTIQLKIPEKGKELVRNLEGTLWEDKRDTENKGIITGDGKFDEGKETGIKGMPLTLEERVSVQKGNAVAHGLVEPGNEKSERADVQYVDVPFVWPDVVDYTPGTGNNIKLNLKKITGFDSTVTTGDNGKYTFTGVPAGNMVVTMDYSTPNAEKRRALFKLPNYQGKNVIDAIEKASNLTEKDDLVRTADADKRDIKYYNGLDFKNTMFYTNNGKSESESFNVLKTWLDKGTKRENNSYLRDDELRRVQITNDFDLVKNANVDLADMFKGESNVRSTTPSVSGLTYNDKLNKAHQLTTLRSTTPKMNFSIEHYEKMVEKHNGKPDIADASIMQEYNWLYAVKGNYLNDSESEAKDLGYNVEKIDLGIVERPKSKLVLDKEITQITLTTANGDKPIDIYYNVDAEVNVKDSDKNVNKDNVEYGKSRQPEKSVRFKRTVDTAKSVGVDYVMSLDRTDNEDGTDKNATDINGHYLKGGFRYINVDQSLLQDSTISVKYGIFAYNLGEVDRKIDIEKAKANSLIDSTTGLNKLDAFKRERELAYRTGLDLGQAKLNSEEIDRYKYGVYAGREYYTLQSENVAESSDKKTPDLNKLDPKDVSKVTVTNIIDLADNNAEVNLNDPANSKWQAGSKEDAIGLIQNITEETINAPANSNSRADIVDSNGISYVKDLGKVSQGNPNRFLSTENVHASTLNSGTVPINTTNVSNTTLNNKNANIKSNLMLLKEGSLPLYPYELLKKNSDTTKVVDQQSGQENIGKIDGKDYIHRWTIKIDRNISSQADRKDLAFENIAEIAEYHTDNGRRTYDTPGNVVPTLDKFNETGEGVVPGNKLAKPSNPNDGYTVDPNISADERRVRAVALEHDSSITEDVTLSPPTGLSSVTQAKTLAVMLSIVAVGMSVGIISFVDKKKFFDKK